MAQNKPSKISPQVFVGSTNPNTDKVEPTKVGDIYVNTALLTLHFAFGLAGTQWGTAGTA